jgi:hypothetical protein
MELSLEAGPAAEGQAASAAPGFGSRSGGISPEALAQLVALVAYLGEALSEESGFGFGAGSALAGLS